MITTIQFKTLDDLYSFYNSRLFQGQLPECILNMSRKTGAYGFFAPERWRDTGRKDSRVHEISLNPDFLQRSFADWHSTLVHEMCHLWQQEFGKPSRVAYHNREWAFKMELLGLMPSDTGQPGGRRTGQSISHYVIPGGAFEAVFTSLDAADLETFRLKYLPSMAIPMDDPGITKSLSSDNDNDNEGDHDGEGTGPGTPAGKSKSGTRIKYTCSCGNHVWGRSGLSILCNDCNFSFTEEQSG
jgi:predicted SprT family Zn-dependent metalloprotease